MFRPYVMSGMCTNHYEVHKSEVYSRWLSITILVLYLAQKFDRWNRNHYLLFKCTIINVTFLKIHQLTAIADFIFSWNKSRASINFTHKISPRKLLNDHIAVWSQQIWPTLKILVLGSYNYPIIWATLSFINQ